MLFSRVFACTEPRSATRKSRPALPTPLPFPPSSHSSLFLSEACALFSVTAVSQPFVYQSLRHSFHRDGGAHPSSQKLCAIFVSCSSPLPVPKPRTINTCKSLSKQRALTIFRMIDLQKTGGGGIWLTNFPPQLSTFDCQPPRPSPVRPESAAAEEPKALSSQAMKHV